jgi:hypothetical protein
MAQADHVSNPARALIPGANANPSINPVRAARGDFFSATAGNPLRPIPLLAYSSIRKDCDDHLETVLDAMSIPLTDDGAHNVPIRSELPPEFIGTIQRAAEATVRIA